MAPTTYLKPALSFKEIPLLEEINELETKIGLPDNFVHRLVSEDDWSFVIKLNALFEASTTRLLTSRLAAPELEDSFSHLDYGNRKFGKVALLKKLGCINDDESKFLQMLFELRNQLAHDIKQVTFDFTSHIEGMDKNQKAAFIKAVKCGRENISWNCEVRPRADYVLSHPKLLIFIAASDILVSMHIQEYDKS